MTVYRPSFVACHEFVAHGFFFAYASYELSIYAKIVNHPQQPPTALSDRIN